MTKWPVQNQTHRTTQKLIEHQNAADIKIVVCAFRMFYFYLLSVQHL